MHHAGWKPLGLVVIVVFIFLQGWRATLIPLLAVPVSLIGTFIIFPALGFSINTLSLFGLVLAIGLVVDDAIIVVEAVEHHIDEGMDPNDATIKAMEEVGGPVVAIALILAAVFIPTAFIPGITGRIVPAVRRHHRDLGTHLRLQRADPFAGARFPVAEAQGPRNARQASWARGFGISSISSSAAPLTVLSIPPTCSSTSQPSPWWHLALVAVVAVLFLGKGLCRAASSQPKTRVTCSWPSSCPTAASAQRTDACRAEDHHCIAQDSDGVQGVIAVNDFSLLTQVQSTNSGFFFVALKPWEKRKTKQQQIEYIQANGAEATLRPIPDGHRLRLSAPSIPGIGTSGGVTMILEDRSGGDDPTTLAEEHVFAFSRRCEQAA